jgi:hypothetical protein
VSLLSKLQERACAWYAEYRSVVVAVRCMRWGRGGFVCEVGGDDCCRWVSSCRQLGSSENL